MISIRGARQHNLRNLDLDLPLGELIVVTGVSGSGKSSLVFDTLYAEGQRRYVETFSPYARQFLDRMDKPAVDRIEGVPPAIAIDQTNPVRTSRSTVGTMTEINDHLKLLFARTATLYCQHCGEAVRRDTPESIYEGLLATRRDHGESRQLICFSIAIPKNFKAAEVQALLDAQGYTRLRERNKTQIEVIQDRVRLGQTDRGRVIEALEAALRVGQGRIAVHFVAAGDSADAAPALTTQRYSADLHCARCDISYREPTPSAFSFNSPLGACDTCRGFGRVIGVDWDLVIPDPNKTLAQGAIRPWQTPAWSECQDDLERHAQRHGVPLNVPWCELSEAQRAWVIEGEGKWTRKIWYGARRFFKYLESKAYKMHIRVLLSKYRSYTRCETCDGARLKPESLLWRVGANRGLNLHELALLPLERLRDFMQEVPLTGAADEAAELVLGEIRTRLKYLCDVGLAYLTLDRQSRTLSGGEVQRINLTTALGTSLVNTLFVLDEPSIGLHPRDMQRVIRVMHRLRDAGNSLVVVEHDPQIMREADRIIDMGPGAGQAGGSIVFNGSASAIQHAASSLTGRYLAGSARVELPRSAKAGPQGKVSKSPSLSLLGVSQHNLKNIDLELPLRRFVCVTGVSGSGKSTLIQDVLHPALLAAQGKPTERPGAFRQLLGAELISEVVMVDQTPIGRTTRSNPASYVGAFEQIRARFAAEDVAKQRGYTAGTFSFNSGTGRCPMCSGNGFEHVEMQFLSDVYLRCGECQGRRYRSETLEVKVVGADKRKLSIADVLDLTVAEALAVFVEDKELRLRLQPLADVGLEYLRLGQAVPTLSGGEAQRLKLAGQLAETAARSGRDTESASAKPGGKLFLFDEPTTGLHFADVAKLLAALRKLLDAGHSLLIIEHNLDVIRAADWVVDLGPEGGEAGGQLVFAGSVDQLLAHKTSHTAVALRQYVDDLTPGKVAEPSIALRREPRPAVASDKAIVVQHAREHNLRNISVEIPRNQFTVLTGVSGSGKSTLAFDIVFNEGQRRYLESLNAYARQFVQPASRPDVDAIYGIPPTVAIEQRTSRGGRKSTVATLTEVYHFLRLLYVKLGTQHCPDCDTRIEPQSPELMLERIVKQHRGAEIELLAPLVVNRKGYYTDLASWARRKGYEKLRVDGAYVPTKPWPRLARFREHTIELPVARLKVARADAALRAALETALEYGKGVVHLLGAKSDQVEVLSARRACSSCGRSFPELDPRLFSFNSRHGWCENCFGTGVKLPGFDAEQSGEEIGWNEWFDAPLTCEPCQGQRLNATARAVRFRDRSITTLTAEPVESTAAFFSKLKLDARELAIGRDLLAEIRSRLQFMLDVGLGYLALDRAAPTLSGGEAQRLRLAAQLGSNLRGVCYVLDEPTIGLHPRDNRILLDALARLAKYDNTLLVVEHDEDTIRRADHVIDLGPGAGVRGGQIVAAGTAKSLLSDTNSITGQFLRAPVQPPLKPRRVVSAQDPQLSLRGADLHNLKKFDLKLPLGRLIAVTGVSGSGKSTLARDVLFASLRQFVGENVKDPKPIGCAQLLGTQHLERVLEVDQTPIGKTPRSCPATYVGFWDEVRRIFAGTNEARLRGFDASRFSFNTGAGRCPTCEGQGLQTIEMNFLPDVKVRCEDCGGKRFNTETLAVRWRDKSIADVLEMDMDSAVEFFQANPSVRHALALLRDVGLGYLTLGQQSPTLSGGEAQRIKLVTELAKVREDVRRLNQKPKRTLYVLDEPTVGLHMADVEKLLNVLHRLVDAGNTVVVVEHNLDVVAAADWVIDLGPEGGAAGGRIVAEGPPRAVARKATRSHTGAALADFLRERQRVLERGPS